LEDDWAGVAAQSEKEAGPLTESEAVGAWFSNPAAGAAAGVAPIAAPPAERAGVGRYLPAAALRGARPPAAAAPAAGRVDPAGDGGSADGGGAQDAHGDGAADARPAAKRLKAGAGYGNFDAW
jgi:hypothetical protein